MTLYSLAAVLIAVLLAMAGQMLLKRGMSLLGPVDREALRRPVRLVAAVATRWEVVLGLVVYLSASLAWIYALSLVELSVAYPFLGMSYAILPVVAAWLLKERPTFSQWVGVTLVVTGVLLVMSSI